MANPFQDFIQLELPKRPFLESDVPEETVLVRRGVAPRQMAAIALADGQVIGKVGGEIVAVTPTSTVGLQHVEETPGTTWTITHNKNNAKAVVLLVDVNGNKIEADGIAISANEIVVTFTDPQAGAANIVFF